ncbi:MFS transporter [Peribacillus deserti]|uniref:MFS transporter n=1 Tax=Peribacillus deserti TaxID=673318 RepID=A0A2N5M043_9BACI|nr:MFS transporter [Peribacillus deserti]PLT27734.1 MFS transporter [Peribacillus deserti]
MNIMSFHRTIKIRLAESFLGSMIGSMIFPFMAIYLSHYFGTKNAGLLLLINVFVGIIINFYGGYFSDQFGRKKIIVFAESLRFLAFFTMMLSNSPWFHAPLLTFFMMTVNSICWGLAGPAGQAMLMDVSRPEERKAMYSILYWANNLSIALGGVLGGFLFKNYLFELLIALTCTSLLTWMLITFFIDESFSPVKSADVSLKGQAIKMFSTYREVFNDRVFILYVLAGLLVLSMEFQLTSYISIRLADELGEQNIFGIKFGGVEMTGFLRTENTILVVFLALFAANLAGKWEDRKVLLYSCLIFVTGYSVISYSNNIWLLFTGMLMATIAEVVRVPVQQNYMASLPPEHARSSYMAVAGLTFNVAMLICSLTVTLSAFLSSFAISIFITGIGVIGILIFILILPELDGRTKAAALETAKEA